MSVEILYAHADQESLIRFDSLILDSYLITRTLILDSYLFMKFFIRLFKLCPLHSPLLQLY
jgi:hypothetical protein